MARLVKTLKQAKSFLSLLAGPISAPESGQVLGGGGQSLTVKAGFLVGAAYKNGTPVAAIAAVQEYGAAWQTHTARGVCLHTVPARPFLRPALQKNAKEWVRVYRNALGQSLAQCTTPLQYQQAQTRALQATGAAMQASIVKAILAVHTPPNAPATIRHKHGGKPLIETEKLLKSVAYQVQA